jgi:hypothetical protein
MEFIDDHPVVSHRVRFQGRGEIDAHEAELARDGDTVVWLVKATCAPPSYHPTGKDAEDRYRFNIQQVIDVKPLDGELRDQAIAYLDHGSEQAFLAATPNGFEPRLPFEDGFPEPAQPVGERW